MKSTFNSHPLLHKTYHRFEHTAQLALMPFTYVLQMQPITKALVNSPLLCILYPPWSILYILLLLYHNWSTNDCTKWTTHQTEELQALENAGDQWTKLKLNVWAALKEACMVHSIAESMKITQQMASCRPLTNEQMTETTEYTGQSSDMLASETSF